MPAAEEELLLTDTQQAGHQRIQSLKNREERPHDQIHLERHPIGPFFKGFFPHQPPAFLSMSSLLKNGTRQGFKKSPSLYIAA